MNVSFEYAKRVDLEKIVQTYNASIPSRLATADLEAVSVESKIPWFNSHNETDRPLWLLSSHGEYAGWMSFNSFYGRPAYHGTVEVSIYLEKNFQGRGIGKTCLEKAIAEAPNMKIHTLLGFIFGHNKPSLKLFYQYEFAKWGHFPEVANMDGKMRDLIVLGRKV
jgi:L-amino acid N-acyltransferase YncA